ncbi:hypothetical protein RsoM2USA_395 [Ralstonia phage RsoM2USA]|nr:hypothetical protein RsoM2USA_395 [Ralstonia phage RsoM2USA]
MFGFNRKEKQYALLNAATHRTYAIIPLGLLAEAFAKDMLEWQDREVQMKGEDKPRIVPVAVVTNNGDITLGPLTICFQVGDFFVEN